MPVLQKSRIVEPKKREPRESRISNPERLTESGVRGPIPFVMGDKKLNEQMAEQVAKYGGTARGTVRRWLLTHPAVASKVIGLHGKDAIEVLEREETRGKGARTLELLHKRGSVYSPEENRDMPTPLPEVLLKYPSAFKFIKGLDKGAAIKLTFQLHEGGKPLHALESLRSGRGFWGRMSWKGNAAKLVEIAERQPEVYDLADRTPAHLLPKWITRASRARKPGTLRDVFAAWASSLSAGALPKPTARKLVLAPRHA